MGEECEESEAGAGVSGTLRRCLHILKQAVHDGTVDSISPDHFRRLLVCCGREDTQKGEIGQGDEKMREEIGETVLKCLAGMSQAGEVPVLAGQAFCLILAGFHRHQHHHHHHHHHHRHSTTVSHLFNTFLTDSDRLTLTLFDDSPHIELYISKPQLFKLSLIYGLLQTDNFWCGSESSLERLVEGKVFSLVETHCLEYSALTVLSFKCLAVWSSRCERLLMADTVAARELMSRLAAITLSNWENPYNAVRDHNTHAFTQLVRIAHASHNPPPLLNPDALLQLVLTETSWMMKSKYFILTILLPKSGTLKTLLTETEDILYGLTTSLCYSHLAPAGTDLYRVCIDDLTLDQWEQIFLTPILQILISSKYMLQKQNIFNYWIPCTIKKSKKAVDRILERLMLIGGEGGKEEDDVLFAVVSCLKLGRKEGFQGMSWEKISTSSHLASGLQHHEPLIRAHSFAAVTVSSKTCVVPTDEEFRAVERFLTENINCDSSPLRQSLLNSFTSFLIRLRDTSLHVLKGGSKYPQPQGKENRALTSSMLFFDWLYQFIESNLEIGVNYQRKITSLELYKIVLNYLACEKEVSGQRKTKTEGHRVMKYAIGVGRWGFTSDRSREVLLYCISDSGDDVRQAAACILTRYFKMNDGEGQRFRELYRKGISLCTDIMFYNADAGALLVYVVTCLAYKAQTRPKGLDIKTDTVMESLVVLAERQSSELRKDVLKATTSGSPLYGVLQAICLLTDNNSPEVHVLATGTALLARLNALIYDTVHHLLQILACKSTSITDYAPSFREMGEEIEKTIEESGVSVEESDKLQLSPAHQLVLNAIWTNLKVCCKLSCRLSGCEIAVKVLRHCRHKGALEAAGSALAVSVRQKPSEGVVPLCQALERLSAGQTLSSRGAGGVILVHRIIANDTRPGKPLVEKALSHILSLVERKTGDLSQCLLILATVLKDASLAQDTANYLHRITRAAFACLAHSSWPVRNAALQLFGSIVPKLVGQKKQTGGTGVGDDELGCSCYHLAYEELYYHCRPLVQVLLDSLDQGTSDDCLLTHARLVSVLTLLSNLTVGLLTIIDRSLEEVFHKMVASFQHLMASRIEKVRQLAAKANAWFCSTSQIGNLIRTRVWKAVAYVTDPTLENEIKSENELHGFLLNTKYLVVRFREERDGLKVLRAQTQLVEESLDELRQIENCEEISYVCRALVKELCGYSRSGGVRWRNEMEKLVSTQVSQPPHKQLGRPHWLSITASQIIENCPLAEILPILNVAIDSDDLEVIFSSLVGLEVRIAKEEFKAVSNGAVNALFRFVSNRSSSRDIDLALTNILDIINRYEINPINLNVDALIEKLLSEDSAVGIAVMCGLIHWKKDLDVNYVGEVVRRLCGMCDAEVESDMERRHYAGRGLVFLAPLMIDHAVTPTHSQEMSGVSPFFPMKANLWQAAVALLQDESPSIRFAGSEFASALIVCRKSGQAYSVPGPPLISNPYSSLFFLHEDSTMLSLFPLSQVVHCLWSEIKCRECEVSALAEGGGWDRAQSSNWYMETVKIVDIASEKLMTLLRNDHDTVLGKLILKQEVIPSLQQLRTHCLMFLTYTEQHNLSNPVIVNREWYIVAKKLGCQFKIINFINSSDIGKDFEMFQYRFQSYVEHITFKV